MEHEIYDNYVAILKSELVPALGCTEPIALAFAAAKAKEALGYMPEKIKMYCSGNIIKNVKGVTVPNSGGLKGIDVAATLGVVGGRADKALEVLQFITIKDIEKAKELIGQGFCECELIDGSENLHIIAEVICKDEMASVEVKDKHTYITKIIKNNQVIFKRNKPQVEVSNGNKELLNVKDIIEFANTVPIERISELLEQQVELNTRIAKEGIENGYGTEVGRTIMEYYGTDVRTRARAMSAAGSDARMSGCALPVVINSGSGNQGITVSVPVIEYAKEMNASKELLYRALAIANLISIHQKRYIGSLSAYCGATSAGCGAGCGIAYLNGGGYKEISETITNTIANIGGMVCDGAKPSCAAKIASAVDAGILGYFMSANNKVFAAGEGLVEEDVEKTIQNLGRMGREGMRSTDVEILNIMIGK
ncbi:MAG: L-serine ammonia-lyase, iron-sulfur-dependent, subunit alpha [Anaerocolumna aminovalerica]|uniref:L-cysteine desulfidase family protein n=1 Tax=Anaerocolumna aminovalerica TaxID=1527 RepID=UPI002906CF81|nr:L-serine ammonia-lyase, iron-sulfur-dependent, subunit alpha [Anaerocolumna aminovalerica]MDU6263005.1 L-serine ammonia-lyase, iron-sulfur-dependent, subunit alpha [Anaerocolumna aminovalerica]